MTNLELLLATARLQRSDRQGRPRHPLIDELWRYGLAPSAKRCCQPPRGVCCWDAV